MPSPLDPALARAARRLLARLVAAGALSALAAGAAADGSVPLFKIVTVRDEVVVGIDPTDASALGGADVTTLGRALKEKGEMTVWQYAVRRGADGTLEQAPLRRISVLGHDSLRVEPYATPLHVLPPQ